MNVPLALALIVLAYWLYTLVDTLRALPYMLRLPRQGPLPAPPPLVSVVIAAKEEEASVGETVRRLMRQTYPRLEIVAVNDRSRDGTGAILERLREQAHVPMKVIHITELPLNWLGKNYALYRGYREASGHYILFTDADIRYEPDAIRDAVAFLEKERADHLTLAPAMLARGLWLSAFVRFFFFGLSLFLRPWRANLDSDRRQGMGIGAFNLLTRQAYEAIGTHKAIAMRPDDDLQLGLHVKKAGLRQRLASAPDSLAVEWYPDLGEALRGLEKNVFSGFGYRTSLALAAVLGQLLLFFFPWIGLWLFDPVSSAVYGACVLLMASLYAVHIRSLTGRPGKEIVLLPFTVLLLVYVISRSVYLTLRRGGIVWRGTFYSLERLKKMTRP